jgi:hypothetical protein
VWYPHETGETNKMHVNETSNRFQLGKRLYDLFPIKYGLQQGDALLPLLFIFDLEYAIRRVQVN